MSLRRFVSLAAIFLSSQFSSPAFAAGGNGEAFYVDPMEIHIEARGRAPTASLKIFNKEGVDRRVRIDVFERTEAADGAEQRALTSEINVDATEFTVKPGQAKKITVNYVGRNRLSIEKAYRIVVKQVEGATSAEGSLDLRFVYEAAVYVAPAQAKAKLIVKEVRCTSDRAIEVAFQNVGNAHQKMENLLAKVEVSDASGRHEAILSEESRQLLSRQNFLAGSRRKLVLQLAPNQVLTRGTSVNVKLVRNNITGR